MKKILVTLGLAFALVATAVASGGFGHAVSSPGESYSTNVSVPNAGFVVQYAENFGDVGYVINNGPAGNYTLSAHQSLIQNNIPIAAGTYAVYQYVSWGANGHSTTVIYW
jgi:hypothetical protein